MHTHTHTHTHTHSVYHVRRKFITGLIIVSIVVVVALLTLLVNDQDYLEHEQHKTDPIISFNGSFIDLLPRSVYFDSRHRDGHDNATVILVQVSKIAIKEKRVVGCGVDNTFTNDFKFEPLGMMGWVHSRYPKFTHDDAMLTCYDMPTRQDSTAFVLYKKNNRSILKLETEKAVYIPPEKVSNKFDRNLSIVVCTTLYGTPDWLREWLVYQKTIGVDFIHIYAQESFITEGAVNNPVLQSYLKSGYAKLDVWKAYLSTTQDYYYQQPLLYVDCIYRYRTEFDYALLYDTDDFFVPVIPGETDIHYYANTFFEDSKIGAMQFRWINYYPDRGLTKDRETIKDGNVTKYLRDKEHTNSHNYKSLYRLSALVENSVHHVESMLPGYKTVLIPINNSYISHLRIKTNDHKPKMWIYNV